MQLDSGRVDSAEAIEGLIGPHSPISLSVGLIQTISRSKAQGLAERFARINKTATPALRAGGPSRHVVATRTDNAAPVLDQSR